jgi:hypothetical protein
MVDKTTLSHMKKSKDLKPPSKMQLNLVSQFVIIPEKLISKLILRFSMHPF